MGRIYKKRSINNKLANIQEVLNEKQIYETTISVHHYILCGNHDSISESIIFDGEICSVETLQAYIKRFGFIRSCCADGYSSSTGE